MIETLNLSLASSFVPYHLICVVNPFLVMLLFYFFNNNKSVKIVFLGNHPCDISTEETWELEGKPKSKSTSNHAVAHHLHTLPTCKCTACTTFRLMQTRQSSSLICTLRSLAVAWCCLVLPGVTPPPPPPVPCPNEIPLKYPHHHQHPQTHLPCLLHPGAWSSTLTTSRPS